MKISHITLSLLFLFAGTIFASEDCTQAKGLFTIQFSWNAQSFSSKNSVEVQYKKDGLLTKSKSTGGSIITSQKNSILSLELSPGVYQFEALKMVGPDFDYGKYLNIPFDKSFEIKAGQVTNGGLFFIGKETKASLSVYFLVLDNDRDIERYVSVHHKNFAGQSRPLSRAWEYIDDQKLNSIIDAYAKTLIPAEENRKRPKVSYLFTTLGILLKMKKDEAGKVLEYDIVSTPSYQEIVKAEFIGNKMLCKLGNGDYWYGDPEEMDYLSYPNKMNSYGTLFNLGATKFLMLEPNYGLHYTEAGFDWVSQSDFQVERSYGLFKDQSYSYPKIYFGKDNMYVYSTSEGKYRRLLRSGYENIHFEEIALSKGVKQVPMITETESQLILGPDLKIFASAKRPAYLYVQERGSTSWNVVDLPRGDCNRFGVDSKNDTIYIITCGGEVNYTSSDAGATWTLNKSTK